MKKTELSAIVPYTFSLGKRLDQVLAELFKEYSRSYLKQLILKRKVFVNEVMINQPNKKILGGETINIHFISHHLKYNSPEKISLNIVYEDNDILIINKPAGLVVHPGAGNNTGTLLNALLYHYKHIKILPRAGIIHRLDKDTTGLMVIAKNFSSYNYLLKLLKKRKIIREYQAIIRGNPISGETIDAPIMRHRIKRVRMMVHHLGKKSVTHYQIINRFKFHTHISIRLETGRTHQIRVHMSYIRYPLVGDPLYKGIHRGLDNSKNQNIKKIFQFPRQALHASHLSFCHPINKSLMSWTIPLPKDMQELLLYIANV